MKYDLILGFNLCNDIEIVTTNQRIEQFKRENRDIIARNRARMGREELEIEEIIEQEKHTDESRKRKIVEEEADEKKKKIRNKEALIDELMFSTGNAKNIVETFANNAQKELEEAKLQEAIAPPPLTAATQFSSGIRIGLKNLGGFLPIPKTDENPLYDYEPLVMDTRGPLPPSWNQLEKNGYLVHIRPPTIVDSAGGYEPQMACLRALQDAFNGLFTVGSRKWSEDKNTGL